MSDLEFHWKAKSSQLKIHGRSWPIENPHSVLCVIHGLGEHIDRYDHLARYYNERGFAVIGYDRSGHGKSDGKRGHAHQFDYYLDEIEELIGQAGDQFPGVPIVTYGHSMGGHLILLATIKRNLPVRAVIATAPVIRLPEKPPALLLAIGKLMLKIYPGFTQANGLKTADLSRDPKIVQDYIDDPLVHDRISSVTAINMLKNADWLDRFAGQMPTPTLIMHGEKDRITSAKGSEAFSQRVGSVDFKMWPGAFHEIHNEPEKESVYQFAIDWLEKKLSIKNQ